MEKTQDHAATLTALADAYREQRRNSREIAKLYLKLREEGMTLAGINTWLRKTAKVSPSDESTISRYITTYKYWMVDRTLSHEAWDRIGHSKLNLLAVAHIGFDSQSYWLGRAFELSYAELEAELKDGTVTLTRSITLRLSEEPSTLWEQARNRLREAVPEFNIPGVKLSDDSMVEFFSAIVLQARPQDLRRLYDSATEMRRANYEDERKKALSQPDAELRDRMLAALQGDDAALVA